MLSLENLSVVWYIIKSVRETRAQKEITIDAKKNPGKHKNTHEYNGGAS